MPHRHRRLASRVTAALTVAVAALTLAGPSATGAPTAVRTSSAQPAAVPAAPYVWFTMLTVTSTSVTLGWTSNRPSVMVRRDDGVGDPSPSTGTLVYSGADVRFVDTGVAPWTTYRYTVWADDGAGGYVSTDPITVTTAVPKVTNLTARATSASTATISWSVPTDPGVAKVVVTRTGPPGTSRTVYSGAGSSVVDPTVVPGVPYSYTAVATDAAGRAGAVSAAADLTTRRTWTTTVASPYAGWPGALACPTSTWCLAVDNTGAVQTMSGTRWSAPSRVFGAAENPWARGVVVQSLTCPAPGRCLTLRLGRVVELSGGHWRYAGAPSTGWSSLDCPTTTFCVAIRYDGWSTTRIGTRWTAPVRIGTLRGVEWSDISCQAGARCFAVGTGTTTRSNWRGMLSPAGWSTGYLGSWELGNARTISCTSSTCLALGDRTRITVSGLAWSIRSIPRPSTTTINDTIEVSCGTPTLCVARNEDDVARWSNGTVVERRRLSAGIGEISAVTCPRTGGVCFAVDDRGRFYRWTAATSWTTVTTYVQTTGGVGRIGCRTATSCFFVDQNGWVVTWDGVRWTRTGKYFTQPAIVECSGSTFCIAVDSINRVSRVWSGGRWGPLRSMPVAATDLSCASPTLCLALDDSGRVSRFSGTSWWSPVATITDQYGRAPSLSCAPSGPCMLLAWNGTYRQYVRSSLTAVKRVPASFPAAGALLSCPTPTMCLAVVDDGRWAQWNGSSWTPHAPDMVSYGLYSLSCVTATACLASRGVSNDTTSIVWNAGTWSFESDAYPEDRYVVGDCPTLATCFVAGRTTVSRSS